MIQLGDSSLINLYFYNILFLRGKTETEVLSTFFSSEKLTYMCFIEFVVFGDQKFQINKFPNFIHNQN